MISKCANPSCARAFLYFRGGKLFLIDRQQAPSGDAQKTNSNRREYLWLCEACASALTVTVGRNGYANVHARNAGRY